MMEIFLELLGWGIVILVIGLIVGYQIGKKHMLKTLKDREV